MGFRASLPGRLWLGIFGLWAVFLSGLPAAYVDSPGIIQAVRLNRLLASKQEKVLALEAELERMEAESQRLEKSRATQEREIRRVLGYAGPDELIFDFTAHDIQPDPASDQLRSSMAAPE